MAIYRYSAVTPPKLGAPIKVIGFVNADSIEEAMKYFGVTSIGGPKYIEEVTSKETIRGLQKMSERYFSLKWELKDISTQADELHKYLKLAKKLKLK